MNVLSGCRNRGFILLSVIMLCVMLVASATAFAWFVRLQMLAVVQESMTLQARSIALLVSKEAIRGLRLDKNKYDSQREEWFQPMFLPLDEYGIVNTMLVPLDDKIPLDKLFLPDGVTLRNELKEPWEKVWVELGRRDLAAKVLDYIDMDRKPRLGGYEGDKNLNRTPADISELLEMEGVTPDILYGKKPQLGLLDYATKWCDNKININTAAPQVLEILDGLNAQIASEIVSLRAKQEIKDFDDLKKVPGFPAKAIPTLMNIIGFTSAYYSLKIELMTNDGSSARYFEIIIHKPSGRIVRWEEM